MIQLSSEQKRMVALGAVWGLVLLLGLPLFNEDYVQWLAQADAGFFKILGRVIAPWTSEPQTWAYADRPIQVLLYWFFGKALGISQSGWPIALIKAGALGLLLARWMDWVQTQHKEASKFVIYAGALLFCTATPVIQSLLRLSDWAIVSQLIFASLLLWFYQNQKAIVSFKQETWIFLGVLFLGTKVNMDLRLLPWVILIWALVQKRGAKDFVTTLQVAAMGCLVTFPWSLQLLSKRPPFLGGTNYYGLTFISWVPSRLGVLLFSKEGFLQSGVGILLLLGVFIVGVLHFAVPAQKAGPNDAKKPAPSDTKSAQNLFWVWLAVQTLAVSAVPFFMRHYIYIWVPLFFLLPQFLILAQQRMIGIVPQFATTALWVIVGLQAAITGLSGLKFKHAQAQTQNSTLEAYAWLEKSGAQSVVFMPSVEPVPFVRPLAFLQSPARVGDVSGLRTYPKLVTWVLTREPSLDAGLSLLQSFTGCSFACNPALQVFIYKLVPGDEAIKAAGGDPQLLGNAWQQDPGNHGLAFEAGLAFYKAGNFKMMNQIYSSFAQHFTGNVGVLYNWGLALSGDGQSAEAIKKFQMAHELAPDDFAIFFNLADAHYRAGDKKKAIKLLEKRLPLIEKSNPGGAASMRTVIESWKKTL